MSEENVPWTLKGVSEEARAAARRAAERSGQTLGEWLSETIRTTDVEEQWAAPTQGRDGSANGDAVWAALIRLEQRMADIERRLDKALAELAPPPRPSDDR